MSIEKKKELDAARNDIKQKKKEHTRKYVNLHSAVKYCVHSVSDEEKTLGHFRPFKKKYETKNKSVSSIYVMGVGCSKPDTHSTCIDIIAWYVLLCIYLYCFPLKTNHQILYLFALCFMSVTVYH